MSLRLPLAATRTYDAMKERPGALSRRSDARDPKLLELIVARIQDLVTEYRITTQSGTGGITYVFWSEVKREVDAGRFDDLLPLL